MTLAFGRDVNLAFNALNGDFTGHLVGWQGPSRLENEAHDFKLLRLEERSRLLARQTGTERLHIYGFA